MAQGLPNGDGPPNVQIAERATQDAPCWGICFPGDLGWTLYCYPHILDPKTEAQRVGAARPDH